MPLFSVQDITWMQSLAGVALTDSCDILYNSNTTGDNQGGKTAATWSVRSTVNCAVIDHGLLAQEPYVNAQLRGKIPETILVPAGTDVRDSDRLRVNNTTYYEVLTDAGTTTPEILRRVICRKLGQGAS